ncbi:hypothetical protein NG819_15495 [Pseudarthrobacter sp. Fe7]|nr:hypothetical protein NG819_15495 [Pseudarthrobacter sp. Fe7]
MRLINDPRGPERLLRILTAGDLASLTDALYQNLDTTSPQPGAEELYELTVEEAERRAAPPSITGVASAKAQPG